MTVHPKFSQLALRAAAFGIEGRLVIAAPCASCGLWVRKADGAARITRRTFAVVDITQDQGPLVGGLPGAESAAPSGWITTVGEPRHRDVTEALLRPSRGLVAAGGRLHDHRRCGTSASSQEWPASRRRRVRATRANTSSGLHSKALVVNNNVIDMRSRICATRTGPGRKQMAYRSPQNVLHVKAPDPMRTASKSSTSNQLGGLS